MDLAFLSTDEEDVILELVEVEAHTTCKTILERFLFLFSHILAFIYYKFKLNNLFGLKFILHEMPVCYSAIT